MDLFKFTDAPGADQTNLEAGEPILGADAVMWVERYREVDEFTIEGPLSSGLREFLPLGTLISHTRTYATQIVESHYILNEPGSDPRIKVSGRGVESFLENRIIGTDQARTSPYLSDYIIAEAPSGPQAVALINDHIRDVTDPNDALYQVEAFLSIGISGGTERTVTLKRGPVLEAVLEILGVDDYGLRSIRPHYSTVGIGPDPTKLVLEVYQGEDHVKDILFSNEAGDFDRLEFLWTLKADKTSAMVVGRYVNVIVDLPGYTKYQRRMMVVDANDIDGNLSEAPTGAALTYVQEMMTWRGLQALTNQNQKVIVQADSSEQIRYLYGRDYGLGDLVSVEGSYQYIEPFRISEYTWIVDENGSKEFPTFSKQNPDS